jgi:Undecaprenyl-phosphate galactose phosphotransferase WbaP
VAVLCLFDLLALLVPPITLVLVRGLLGHLDPVLYRFVLPMLLIGPALGARMGLYQTIALPPAKEVKAYFIMASTLYAMVLAAFFVTKTGSEYSRFILVASWCVTLFSLPIMRSVCRRTFCTREWWGQDVVLFERSPHSDDVLEYLRRHPMIGLRPVEHFHLPSHVAEARRLFARAAASHPDAMAIIPHMQGNVDYLAEAGRYFSDILVSPAFVGGDRMHWLTVCTLGTTTALWKRQNLLDKRRLRMKRCIDLIICILSLVPLLPLCALIAVCIRLDSKGPVIYRQSRIGKDGATISIYKFRTMVCDADKVLARYLADPDLAREWETGVKLKDDPRVTRVGAFLRRTSLDELPQILNVLTGDMSLVGPRPLLENELWRYGRVYELYSRVRPGITGLWQVSGRNETTYDERLFFVGYYINNWSVWMDLWILAKTVPVALSGYGAY